MAADRKRNWTRWLVTALVVVAVLAVAAFVYQQWLAPSPEVVLAVSAVNDVEQLAFEQKWDEAFALTEKHAAGSARQPRPAGVGRRVGRTAW